MIRTAEFKLRPSPALEAKLAYRLELCRQLYNAALQERRDAWKKQRKSISLYDQQKEFPEVRLVDERFKGIDVQMIRATVFRRLDHAFQAFFRRCKTGETPGYPRFKGKDRFKTLVFATQGWKLEGKKLHITGVGVFRLTSNDTKWKGTPKGIRLINSAGRWFVQVILDVGPPPAVTLTKDIIGIDVGLKTFATLSDGSEVQHPKFLNNSLGKLTSAQRTLDTKKRGSHRRQKAKKVVTRIYSKIADQRKDFIRKEARRIGDSYAGFAVEKLDIREMVSKEHKEGKTGSKALRRGIMDSAWGFFSFRLGCIAEEAGKPFLAVDPRGTTQRCSRCGTIVKKGLGDRIHSCFACGLTLDRDLNAALNISDLGRRLAEESSSAENSDTPSV